MTYTQPMLRDGALDGKTIVVTGGGTGLGKSMSKYFLELGANVVITSRKMQCEKCNTFCRNKISADACI